MMADHRAASRPADRRVLAIGVASAALYAGIYATERALSPAQHAPHLAVLTGLYVAATAAIFAAYAAIVALASSGEIRGSRARMLSLAFPVLFCLALTIGRPYFSIDLYSYIAEGRQASLGHNPYAEAPTTLAGTQAAADLRREGWLGERGVSPYGPLWTMFEVAADRVTRDIPTEALLIKMAVTAFTIGCAVLVWLIVGRVLPKQQLLGTVLFLWNPVVILEFAGEGHNDAAVIFFMLLSLYLVLRRKVGESVVAMVFGALVKIVGFMLLPMQLVYAWRTARDRRRLLETLAIAFGAAAVLTVVVYAPVWIGVATFDGLRAHARPNVMSPSTASVLYMILSRSGSEGVAARLVALLVGGGFIAYVAVLSATIRDAATLVRACGALTIGYFVLAPGYWPWYAATPVTILTLAPGEEAVWSIFALSFASRVAAPIDVLRIAGVMEWSREILLATIVGVWVPAACIAAFALRRASVEWRARAAVFAVLRPLRPHM